MSVSKEETQLGIKLSEKVQAFLQEVATHPKYTETFSNPFVRTRYRRRVVALGAAWIHVALTNAVKTNSAAASSDKNIDCDDLDDKSPIKQERFLLIKLNRKEGIIHLNVPKYQRQNRVEFSFIGINNFGVALERLCCATDEGFMLCDNNDKVFPNVGEFLKFLLENELKVTYDESLTISKESVQNKGTTSSGLARASHAVSLSEGDSKSTMESRAMISSAMKSSSTSTLESLNFTPGYDRTFSKRDSSKSESSARLYLGAEHVVPAHYPSQAIGTFDGVDEGTQKLDNTKITKNTKNDKCIIC